MLSFLWFVEELWTSCNQAHVGPNHSIFYTTAAPQPCVTSSLSNDTWKRFSGNWKLIVHRPKSDITRNVIAMVGKWTQWTPEEKPGKLELDKCHVCLAQITGQSKSTNLRPCLSLAMLRSDVSRAWDVCMLAMGQLPWVVIETFITLWTIIQAMILKLSMLTLVCGWVISSDLQHSL